MSRGSATVKNNFDGAAQHNRREEGIYIRVTDRYTTSSSAALSVDDATVVRDQLTELIDEYNAVVPVEPTKQEILRELPIGSIVRPGTYWQPVVKIGYKAEDANFRFVGSGTKHTLDELGPKIDDGFEILYRGEKDGY